MEENAVIVYQSAGLGNRIGDYINALHIKQETNRPVYFFTAIQDHFKIPNEEVFLSDLPTITLGEFSSKYLSSFQIFGYIGDAVKKITDHPNERIYLSVALPLPSISLTFFREKLRTINWSKAVLEGVQMLSKKYSIDQTVSGIHIRTTDHVSSSVVKKKLIKGITSCSGRILLCSEDEPLKNEMQSLYPHIIVIPRSERNSTDGPVEAAIDLLLLSLTTIKYYSPRSTFSRIALAIQLNSPDLISDPKHYLKYFRGLFSEVKE